MCQIEPEKRLQIVQHYLSNNTTLMQTANKFNIHYRSVYKWVKLYKKEGKQRLLLTYRRAWNRYPEKSEKVIVLLKENDPTLTVRKAKEILKKRGITISIKGIWGIWKRYGYTGFNKSKLSNDFTDYIVWTKEAKSKFTLAKKLFEEGNIKKSAKILNSIPSLPKNALLLKIPDNLLNLRRRVEKVPSLFGEIPLTAYLKKVNSLYNSLRQKGLNYSAVRVGLMEAIALEWKIEPQKSLNRLKELEKIIKKRRSGFSFSLFAPHLTLLVTKGVINSQLYRIEKAIRIARYCDILLKSHKISPSYLMVDLGSLYSIIENYKKKEYWFLKAFNGVEKKFKNALKGEIAYLSLYKGDVKQASRISKNAEYYEWGYVPLGPYFKSILSIMQGKPNKAISFSLDYLSQLKEKELKNGVFAASRNIAGAYYSLNENKKAESILRKIIPFLKKNNMKKEWAILEILSHQNKASKMPGSSLCTLKRKIFPTVRLALLLKNNKYFEALSFARQKYLIHTLHTYLFFFPDNVINLLNKGKPTGLSKAILKLPVFNKEAPVYEIKFLGSLTVYKNQKYLKIKLRPKDTAFLIQFALKAGEPGKSISLDKIYYNFWRNSVNPPRNLSHMLVRIKKELKIPSHLIEVSYRKDNPVLINRGIHFITDYDEYKQSLAQAKALLRAGEWGFAKREFNRAFKLFRGGPFRKMYDNWSDDKRLEVLFSYEKEVKTFADELRKRGKTEEAEKVLERAERIVGSE